MKHFTMLPRGVSLLAALMFCVLSGNAQKKLQFWYDSDQTVREVNFPLSGTLTAKANVQHLPNGFHTIYIRVKQTGAEYEYSPISMSSFINFATGEGTKLQYWFDDDADNFSTIDVDAESGKAQTLTLDLSNIERFPLGVHQLNIRVAYNGGHYSPIYSAYVLRLPIGAGDSVLEYWFDDDYENRATKTILTNNYRQQFDIDLSNSTKFPYGIHRLNMRVVADGTRYSPIYSSVIMKHRVAKKSDITYWVDDDYANRKVWKTKLKSDGSYYQLIQLPTKVEGMHRLKIRVTNDGVDDGPVYESAFLLSKRFSTTGSGNVMTECTWIDDATPFNNDLTYQLYTYTGTYVLDPSVLSEGQHSFHVMYKNTYDMWSSQNVTYFYKDTSGMLRAGRLTPDDDVTAIEEATSAEHFSCYYRGGLVVVDCQSAKLASTGVVMVCDLTGKVIAREDADCSNGLHVELPVGNIGRQMLIVKVLSGDVHFTRKLIAR